MFPNPSLELKTALIRRMQADHFDDKVFTVVKQAYADAIRAEGIVFSRAERDRLLRELMKDLLGEMLKKL